MSESEIRYRRADDARRTSEGRYRALFEHAPDGILIADAGGRCVDANAAMCAMLGYSHQELLGLGSADILVPSQLARIAPALTAIVGGPHNNREWEFLRMDGTKFCADVTGTVMPDGTLMAFVRDNTVRNAATAAVRAADQRFRFALRSAHVGIWDMDYITGVLDWSEEMDAQYGVAPGMFGGTFESFMERIHVDDRAAVVETLDHASKTGAEFSVLHRVATLDGKLRWLSAAGRFVLDPDGKPLRAIGISRDVTERHLLEAQFQQAQKMEAVGRLAGGVAHDFNNLLTVILGFCELMLDGVAADDGRVVEIGQIQEAARRAAGLTRQLLAFSRKEIIEPKILDLNAVIESMRPMLARLVNDDVKIVFGPPAAAGLIKGDRGQLEQVVLNLVVNAQDAMPTGGTLTIEVANVELDDSYAALHLDVRAGAYVALIVTDSGVGMESSVIERLFEPFFTTKEVGRGTGLGLASVHGIVAAGGGTVRVYSEVGHGSSFKVYLPRVTSGEAASNSTAPPTAFASGTETVLIVEDAQGLREVTTRLLRRQGYTVIAAANAVEAERLFEWNPQIALLLTDVVMPGCSGPELARRLAEKRPGLKVLYMSGYTDEAIVQHGVLKPGIAFLHKPFTSNDLGRKLRETLDR